MIGWDVIALGLPASDQPFVAGSFTQSIELPGRWLDRGTVRGEEPALLDSPLGWAGQRTLATLWFGAGEDCAGAPRGLARRRAGRLRCPSARAARAGAPPSIPA